MRTIIDLPEEQLTALARFCQQQNISRAEAVRRAVGLLIKSAGPEEKDVGFGIWKHKRTDSRKYVAKLRGEWGPSNEPGVRIPYCSEE